jgi:plasmid stability protein
MSKKPIISATVDDDVHREVTARAKHHGTSVSFVIADILRDWMDTLPTGSRASDGEVTE